uniref:Delta-like protein n=1 Tax=Neogobius melanostomus TaxID=47308 RepID=A0A8C6T3E5_9GOBI
IPHWSTILAAAVFTAGVFEMRIDSFSSTGDVCSSSDCQVFFRICLKHAQDVINPEPPCTYGTKLTDNYSIHSLPGNAPVVIPFEFKWPVSPKARTSASLCIYSLVVFLPAGNQNKLITRLATRRTLRVGQEWSQYDHYGDRSELRFSYHVICSEFYHGEACTAYCRPRNDTFGHYACDEEGVRQCLRGWTGEYCAHPICAPGCSETHGYCKAPGECVCRQGWQGERCDECEQHPGCVHGTCNQPWQCNCKEGWGGLYCDQDLNYCTNHKPCQNDAACTNTGQGSYTCTCKPGFSGTNCEIETNECDSNPCKNGGSCSDLVNDYSCTCPQGFYGKNCEIIGIFCTDEPCFYGGTCVENPSGGYSCRCLPGFTGSNCEKKDDRCSSNPCANGAQCSDDGNRFVCRCRPGFSGPRCETNDDDCASHPCKNAGTCVDGVNDYTCSCTLGYNGKDCSVRDTPCSNFPCENGGRCPITYMGARCEFKVQTTIETPKPADAPPPVLMVAFALGFGIVTLALLIAAALFILRQLRGMPNNGAILKEKEAFLIPGPHVKVSNKSAALEKGIDSKAVNKNNMADSNLAKDDKNKLDFHVTNQCKSEPNPCFLLILFNSKYRESTILVSPLNSGKENRYHPIYIIPDQFDQCVIATEVKRFF